MNIGKLRKASKRIVLLFACASTALSAVAQFVCIPDTVHFRLRYVINIPEIDSTFVDNASRITDMREFLRMVRDDNFLRVRDVRFRGTASPDGPYDFNVWLSENRLRTFKALVRSYIDIPDSVIHANTSNIPWDEFRASVEKSDIEYRDEILAIIDEESRLVPFPGNRYIDARLLKLKKLHQGKAWEILKAPILHDLRYGDAVFAFERIQPEPYKASLALLETDITPPPILHIDPLPLDLMETWVPRLYVKTNFIALAMLSANLAVELDLARHWSVTLPVSYCAMDWFKSTIKFRNFTVKPELRYWFNHKENDKFFVGTHFQLCYYNYAFDGQYRFQDFRGRTPAIGGGIGFGYRKPISSNKRWRMEFELGAGIYPLDYSVFWNTPDVRDGQWVERRKETYIGIDNAAVTLAYTFDLNRYRKVYARKGGRR